MAIGNERVSTPKAYKDLDVKYNNFANRSDDACFSGRKTIENPISTNAFDLPFYNIFEEVTSLDEIDLIKEIMRKNGAEQTLALENSGFTAFACHSVYPEVNI